MRLKGAISYLFIILLFSGSVFGQKNTRHEMIIDIPEVALLALQSENDQSVNYNAVQPAIAGQTISFNNEKNTDVWINYSSIVRAGQKRKVTATVIGHIPPGIIIKVMTSESRGNGRGKLGESHSWTNLSNASVDVISNIGSCYTGRGVQNGHLLNYKIELDDQDNSYAQLAQSETSLQILYTLTDDN